MELPPDVDEKYSTLSKYFKEFGRKIRKHGEMLWEDNVADDLKFVGVVPDENKIIFKFNIQQKHCSYHKKLPSGCVATLISCCGALALGIHQGEDPWEIPGLQTHISVSCIQGIGIGETARIECELQKLGRATGYVGAKIYDTKSNRLCYTGSIVVSRMMMDSKL